MSRGRAKRFEDIGPCVWPDCTGRIGRGESREPDKLDGNGEEVNRAREYRHSGRTVTATIFAAPTLSAENASIFLHEEAERG